MQSLFGSICIEEIPDECKKRVMCKDGRYRTYVNVLINELHSPVQYPRFAKTHIITCYKKGIRGDMPEAGRYIIGQVVNFGMGLNGNGDLSPESVNAEARGSRKRQEADRELRDGLNGFGGGSSGSDSGGGVGKKKNLDAFPDNDLPF